MRPRPLTLAALVVALSASGCNAITSGGDRVVLATSINPALFALQDTSVISITINNIALTRATIEAANCGSFFEVYDTQGNLVGPGVIDDCGTEALPATIEVGQAFTLVGVWTGTSTGSTPANPTYLAPGTYRLRGRVSVRELGTVTGSLVTIRVTE
jgi:hypothetical protein